LGTVSAVGDGDARDADAAASLSKNLGKFLLDLGNLAKIEAKFGSKLKRK